MLYSLNRNNDALGPEHPRGIIDQTRIFHGRRIDGYFIRPCPQKVSDIIQGTDTAPAGLSGCAMMGLVVSENL